MLIHYHLGINRSAVAVVAYLCHMKGLSTRQVEEWVRERKADVRVSRVFLAQIDRCFRRESGDGEEEEDVLVGVYRRLAERKMGLLKGGGEDEGKSDGKKCR